MKAAALLWSSTAPTKYRYAYSADNILSDLSGSVITLLKY